MTRISLALATAGTLTLSLGAATAATEWDTDGDGMYSFEELLTAVPTLTEEAFLTIDSNGDGAVDADELAAAQESGVVPMTES